MQNSKSAIPLMTWPPLTDANNAPLKSLVNKLENTQWLSRAEIEAEQFRQLRVVAEYAVKHSPFFAAKMKESGLTPEDICSWEGLKKLPVMTRRELQGNIKELLCREVPRDHLPVGEVKTSGSSGEPVVLARTAVNQLFWLAYGVREHLWNKRDAKGVLSILRANLPGNNEVRRIDWGAPVGLLYNTGAAYALPINRDISEQVAWLEKTQPDYLLVYPNNLAALLDAKVKLGNIKQVRTIGETLSSELRQRVKNELGVSVADLYSSQELGTIAMECPETGLYHVMAESLIVEVLNENGEDCKPGETGRVVVTDLTNFATPIFRYDIRDYAEVAAPCACGRGLPALKKVAGRERNMVVVNGEKRWPLVGFHLYREVAPVLQYQLVQKTEDFIEVRLVVSEPLTETQENKLAEIIRNALGFAFRLEFKYFEGNIPRPASGKFDEFICELTQKA